MPQHLRLISHKLCPYVQRAVIVATEKNIPFERVDIDLASKPDWFLKLSPTGKVPVLEVTESDGTTHILFESAVIAEYLDEISGERLLPSEPLARARQRAWVEYASTVLADIARLYSSAGSGSFDDARISLEARLETLEHALAGPWFAGERFGRLVLIAPAGLNHPDHPAADLAAIGPEALPGYLAHHVDVALRYFPGGAQCPPLEEFLAARGKEGKALEGVLKVHGMGHPNLGRWLSRIPNETLVVWGTEDRMMPASQAPVWAERIPNARTLIVANAGHFSMQEDPRVVTAIGDFLAG